jgi:hypothetical protein
MKKNLLLIIFTFYSVAVLAYSECNHAFITQCAIDLLNKKFGSEYISPKEAKEIINGNCSEDHFGLKWSVRLWNQHFYNPLKPKKYYKRVHSIDVRFERIAKRCFKRKSSSKYYFSIGEISHHIQDVTNPAHVVRIYHGGKLKDNFDEQYVSPFFPNKIEIDTTLSYKAPFHRSILAPTAIKTLGSINAQFEVKIKTTNDSISKTINWSYFWEDNPTDWFGKYGILGGPGNSKKTKTDNYLSEKIQHGDAIYYIDKKDYDNYSSQQIELAVVQTAQFIYYAKSLEQQKIKPNK